MSQIISAILPVICPDPNRRQIMYLNQDFPKFLRYNDIHLQCYLYQRDFHLRRLRCLDLQRCQAFLMALQDKDLEINHFKAVTNSHLDNNQPQPIPGTSIHLMLRHTLVDHLFLLLLHQLWECLHLRTMGPPNLLSINQDLRTRLSQVCFLH